MPIIPDDVDALANDELSLSKSLSRSPLPGRNTRGSTRAKSRRKHSHRSTFNDAVNGAFGRAKREANRKQNQLEQPTGNASMLPARMIPPVPLLHLAFSIRPTFYMPPTPLIWGLDDMLSSPLWQHILDYEPPHEFVIPTFTMFDGSVDPSDHMHHYNQAMTLNVENDYLLCKVFPASLRGPTLSYFHKLPCSSINLFNELWGAFISQYLCSMRQKRNISSLQTILKQEEESIRDFTRRFEQAVQSVESYNMDAVLQNFKRSFGPSTLFFHSLSLESLVTMEELYRQADKYSMLEDNIHATAQIVMIINKLAKGNKPYGKKPYGEMSYEPKEGQRKDTKRSCDQS